jgi:hypothetical protein
MSSLHIHIDPRPRDYTGAELRSHFAYTTYGISGDSGVAFAGRCSVGETHMVDVEDLRARDFIAGDRMLHFIIEHFEERLTAMVLRQRLLARLAAAELERLSGREIRVRGDDLFHGDGKLSVSVATCSPVSGLIHLGLNVTNDGTPVKTASLADLGLQEQPVASAVLEAYRDEIDDVRHAAMKVRWVP